MVGCAGAGGAAPAVLVAIGLIPSAVPASVSVACSLSEGAIDQNTAS